MKIASFKEIQLNIGGEAKDYSKPNVNMCQKGLFGTKDEKI